MPCAHQLANRGHLAPRTAYPEPAESACGAGTGWLPRAGAAWTIRADVARAKGREQPGGGSVRGMHRPAAARGSTFLTLVLALMLAAAVFALIIVLMLAAAVFALIIVIGLAALVVLPAAVIGLG